MGQVQSLFDSMRAANGLLFPLLQWSIQMNNKTLSGMEPNNTGSSTGPTGHLCKPVCPSHCWPQKSILTLQKHGRDLLWAVDPGDLPCRYWMTLRSWACEMALSTQKVGSFQKQQLCSRRQVVAISSAWSSFPARRPSSP